MMPTLRVPGVKLVNFWASWCAPCRAEHPMLEQLAAEGVKIYGVNYKDTPDKAHGLPWLNWAIPLPRWARIRAGWRLDWGVYGVPETYVIDGDGKILSALCRADFGAGLGRHDPPGHGKSVRIDAQDRLRNFPDTRLCCHCRRHASAHPTAILLAATIWLAGVPMA